MTCTGKVEGGVIKLPPGVSWPDGTTVRVEAADETSADRRAIANELRRIAATMPPLPPDLAEQHDHYLYGTARH